MAPRKLLVAAGIGLAAVASVASATALGTFDGVALSASTHRVTACTADVDLLDSTDTEIPLGVDLSGITIDGVRVSNVDGDCEGTAPQVIVIGEDPPLTADEVLDISDPVPGFDPAADVPQDLELAAGDSLRTLLGTLDLKRVTELRIAFVPT